MNDVVIRVEGLGKQYRIGLAPERYRTLRDTLVDTIALPFRAARNLIIGPTIQQGDGKGILWALKDVSFDVNKGEAVGIIGRNGAGKSTLLQLICGTLNPTCGFVEVQGIVAALLELGSGFNPEFTGRENVYLSAAMLGLGHEEIEDKFDEIAGFADIGDFLEQPVKIYSSGMLMRLAFAVNTCINPEVLIVDEALGVGDAPFQSKCFKRLRQLIDDGTSGTKHCLHDRRNNGTFRRRVRQCAPPRVQSNQLRHRPRPCQPARRT